MCSSAMLVTTAISPSTMLVESSRPPKPTSITAHSTPRFAEDEKGGGGEKVEPGCVGRGRAGLAGGLVGVERLVERPRERRLVDIVALNADPLGDTLDMRRGVAADAKAGMRQRRLDQGRDRPLALGARDMDRAEGLLRVAEARGEILHRLEADAHHVARPTLPVGERVEPGQRLREMMILGHRAADTRNPALS